MRRRFRNSFWLFLLLVNLVVKSVAGNPGPGKAAPPVDSAKSFRLSACSHLSNSEAEESSSINETGLCSKCSFAAAVLHVNTTGSNHLARPQALAQMPGRNTLISPFYSRMLFPFHVFW